MYMISLRIEESCTRCLYAGSLLVLGGLMLMLIYMLVWTIPDLAYMGVLAWVSVTRLVSDLCVRACVRACVCMCVCACVSHSKNTMQYTKKKTDITKLTAHRTNTLHTIFEEGNTALDMAFFRPLWALSAWPRSICASIISLTCCGIKHRTNRKSDYNKKRKKHLQEDAAEITCK